MYVHSAWSIPYADRIGVAMLRIVRNGHMTPGEFLDFPKYGGGRSTFPYRGGCMFQRYIRQVMLNEVGKAGQERLRKAAVAVIGCGGLGTVVSDLLVRAGVGFVKIVDRDTIELSNLQRQTLYDEDDLARNLPKAETAAIKLKKVNSEVVLEPWVIDVNAQNIEDIVSGVDLVVDGTDNFETRYLINETCVAHNIPWVYASVAATCGMTMAVVPRQTACLQCFCGDAPFLRQLPSSDTVGIWGPVVNLMAALEVSESLKLLMGVKSELQGSLLYVDLWAGTFDTLRVHRRVGSCPVCG